MMRIIQRHGNYTAQGFWLGARVLIGKPCVQANMTRMIDAVNLVQNEANQGNEFFKLLLGNTGNSSMEQRIREFSARNMPQIDVDAEVEQLQNETQRILGLRLNGAQESALR